MFDKLKVVLARLWYGSGVEAASDVAAPPRPALLAALTEVIERGGPLSDAQLAVLHAEIFRKFEPPVIATIFSPDDQPVPQLDALISTAVHMHQVALTQAYYKLTEAGYQQYLPLRPLTAAIIRRLGRRPESLPSFRTLAAEMRRQELQYNPMVDDSAFQIAWRRSYELTAALLESML